MPHRKDFLAICFWCCYADFGNEPRLLPPSAGRPSRRTNGTTRSRGSWAATSAPARRSTSLEMWQADTFDPADDRPRAWLGQIDRHQHGARVSARATVAGRSRWVFEASRQVSGDRRPPRHSADVRVLRRRVGSRSAKRAAAPAAHGRAQQRLGAKPGPRRAGRPREAGCAPALRRPTCSRAIANDERVLAWDLFNEPDNDNSNSYGPLELKNKDEAAERLVRLSFQWARAVGPSQPLTVGVWRGEEWDKPESMNRVHRAAVELSDVISFHDYRHAESMTAAHRPAAKIRPAAVVHRVLARGNGSTFEDDPADSEERKSGRLLLGPGRRQNANQIPVVDLADADPRRAAIRGTTKSSTPTASRIAKPK